MSAPPNGPVRLLAAGSLKAALTEIARDFTASTGHPVETTFAPSGLLRAGIEAGTRADVFASADMDHPRALETAGLAGPVRAFARNVLCALVRPDLAVPPGRLLDVMLDPAVRLGASTPGSDPSGDYAWQMFARAARVRPGAEKALAAKALQLTGGPRSETAPDGRNPYAWVLDSGRADLFLTYRTNALLARRENSRLDIVDLPDELSVGAEYGLTVMTGASPAASALASHILAPAGQRVLVRFGFGGRA